MNAPKCQTTYRDRWKILFTYPFNWVIMAVFGFIVVAIVMEPPYKRHARAVIEEPFEVDTQTPIDELIMKYDPTAKLRKEYINRNSFIGEAGYGKSRIRIEALKKADAMMLHSNRIRHAYLNEVLSWTKNPKVFQACRVIGCKYIVVLGTVQKENGGTCVPVLEIDPVGVNRIHFFPSNNWPYSENVAIALR